MTSHDSSSIRASDWSDRQLDSRCSLRKILVKVLCAVIYYRLTLLCFKSWSTQRRCSSLEKYGGPATALLRTEIYSTVSQIKLCFFSVCVLKYCFNLLTFVKKTRV